MVILSEVLRLQVPVSILILSSLSECMQLRDNYIVVQQCCYCELSQHIYP